MSGVGHVFVRTLGPFQRRCIDRNDGFWLEGARSFAMTGYNPNQARLLPRREGKNDSGPARTCRHVWAPALTEIAERALRSPAIATGWKKIAQNMIRETETGQGSPVRLRAEPCGDQFPISRSRPTLAPLILIRPSSKAGHSRAMTSAVIDRRP